MTFINNYARAKSPWIVLDDTVYLADKQGVPVHINKKKFSFAKKGALQEVERDCALRILAQNKPIRIESSIDSAVSTELAKKFYSYLESQEVSALKRVIERKRTSLGELLPGFDGYFSNGDKVFGMQRNNAGTLSVKGNSYSLTNIGSAPTLDNQYSRLLVKNTPVFRESSLAIKEVRGGHRILATIQPFAMEHKGAIHPMDGCTLGYDFVFGNRFVLKNYPRVFSPSNYQHPFVYSNMEICRGLQKAYESHDIKTETPYDTSRLEKLIFPAAEAVRMMRTGYSDKSTPVRHIQDFSRTNWATCKKKKLGVYSHG